MAGDRLLIRPVTGPLRARATVPGSKSLTNRAIVAAALSSGPTVLTGALIADDSRYMVDSLARLGFEATLDEARRDVRVEGQGGRIPAARAELHVGNAGTAARFLTAVATLGSGEYLIDGVARMRERPIADLVGALGQLGASIECPTGCPPVRILARGLDGGTTRVGGEVSSQFLSALLLAAPCARRGVEIVVDGVLRSRPYVDMTIAVMRDFGVEVDRRGYERFTVRPAPYRSPGRYRIEADASAASYFFAAAAIAGGSVRVDGLDRRSSQGDIRFADLLGEMGCQVRDGDGWIAVTREGELRGVAADLGDMPDTAMTLAAVAPFATTPTVISGIASARLKESDRIAATAEALVALGVEVAERPDGLVIQPCARIGPALVRTRDDHRMAMSFALVGLRAPGVTIDNPGCVAKTFPGYFEALDRLRRPEGADSL